MTTNLSEYNKVNSQAVMVDNKIAYYT